MPADQIKQTATPVLDLTEVLDLTIDDIERVAFGLRIKSDDKPENRERMAQALRIAIHNLDVIADVLEHKAG
jgi:hypothetical protein